MRVGATRSLGKVLKGRCASGARDLEQHPLRGSGGFDRTHALVTCRCTDSDCLGLLLRLPKGGETWGAPTHPLAWMRYTLSPCQISSYYPIAS